MLLVALSMAFVTLLVVANITAVKLVGVGSWVVPVAVIAYPFTFLVTDTISEIFGRHVASRVVWLGFGMSLLMALLVYLSTIIPAVDFWEGQPAYSRTLGSVPRIVAASMAAYLASQLHDVYAFHFWKRLTKARFLWLRNNFSTAVSQGIDTLVFISVAFVGTVPAEVLWGMVGAQYVVKLLIALADTPLLYALVAIIRRSSARQLQAGDGQASAEFG